MAKKKGPYRPPVAESTTHKSRVIFKDLFSGIYMVYILKDIFSIFRDLFSGIYMVYIF